MADYVLPEQWGSNVNLSYVPSSSWFTPAYQGMLPGTVPEGQPYSGMYLAPTSWMYPAYRSYATQYQKPSEQIDASDAIQFPTADEATAWASQQYPFQQQANLLNTMSSPQGFQQYLNPYLQQAFQSIGRSGLPSSSYADRMISDTVANAWAQNALNTAGAWNTYGAGLGDWAAGYAQYPLTVAGLLQG